MTAPNMGSTPSARLHIGFAAQPDASELVLHGARYSPHDNPVERNWAALKAWLVDSPTLTIQGRIRQVHAFLRTRVLLRCMLATAAPYSSPWLPEGYLQDLWQAAWTCPER